VLENIYRHMEMGKHKRIAALEGRNEIGFTALSITLVDVVVFVPLALTNGLIGNILREFSLVIVFSTLMSLFVAFTLTPMLASRWGKLEILKKDSIWGRINIGFENALTTIKNVYSKILNWSLHHMLATAGIISILFISTVIAIPMSGLIGTTFMAQTDRGELSFQIDLPPEYTISKTNQVIQKVEHLIMKNPDVKKVFSKVGTQTGQANSNAAANSNIAEITVSLVDKKKRNYSTTEYGQRMRDSITAIPGLKLVVAPVGIMGNDVPIQAVVSGPDLDSVKLGANELLQLVKSIPGTDFVRFSTKSPKKDIAIHINREKASLYGLSVAQIGGAVQLAFQGNDDTKYKYKGEEYDINITLDKADKQTIEDIHNLTLQNSSGAIVRLEDVADIAVVEGQSIRERYNRMPSIKIESALVHRSLGKVIEDIKTKVKAHPLPKGTNIIFLGAAENMKTSMESLLLSLGIGILLIYFVMVALYESVTSPFVVLFSIPVSFVGAFLALGLTMNELSIFAMLGLIMLLGLVAKNAILIVDFVDMRLREGAPILTALIEAGEERLRPIMMTTFAMVFGMLPIAMASGDGAEIKNGMAWVILGGLTSSMILTVILVPCVYYMFFKIKTFFQTRKRLRRMHRKKKVLEA
ncbi:MAG TPA: efflux RND transporter permease subunit, partial [Arachidicoccus soli]|nr:efflux RND transporter permease subunit [Arachidicoccus soli]